MNVVVSRPVHILFRSLAVVAVLAAVLTITGCKNGPFSSQSADVPDVVTVTPDDPLFSGSDTDQWYLQTIRAPAAWGVYEANARFSNAGEQVRPVVISVVDSGIVAGHEDLSAVLTTDGISFLQGTAAAIPGGIPTADGSAGHGTHVAGLIAAQGANGRGIAGATYNGWPGPMFLLRTVAALEFDPSTGQIDGTVADVIAGILYAVGGDNERTPGAARYAAVINMSLGASALGRSEKLLFEDALAVAAQADVLVVAAGGNAGSAAIDYPARFPEVIAVGSVDADRERSSFSNYGPELELVAPGARTSGGSGATGLVSTYDAPSGYALLAGTSMATPLVAAAAAMVRSANPYLSAADTRHILRDTARDLGPAGLDEEYGYGLVDMEAALGRALREPYGRFSSSVTERGIGEIAPRVLSTERRAEYDRARAEETWDAAAPPRVSVVLRAGSDPEVIAALPDVRRVGQTAMPDGILLRLELTGSAPRTTFETLRTHPAVLLVHQERTVQFLSADFLQSLAD